MENKENSCDILIYQSDDGNIKVDVQLIDESVWLTQGQMAQLFNKDKRTISEHISNIFKDGELQKDSVVRNFRTTADDGKSYDMNYYNLDVTRPARICKSVFTFLVNNSLTFQPKHIILNVQ